MLDDDLRTALTAVLPVSVTANAQASGTSPTVQGQDRDRTPARIPSVDQRGGQSELRSGEEDLLRALTRLARAVLPATSGVCLTLQESRRVTRTLSDSALAEAMDRAQRQAGAGPSLSAAQAGQPCCSPDLVGDPRWTGLVEPISSPDAVGAGVPHALRPISVVALPLSHGSQLVGVLTLYGEAHPVLVDEQDITQLMMLAAVAAQLAGLTSRARRAEEVAAGVQMAIATRAPVEQAKGIVAARIGMSPEQAFDVISSLSQDSNVKVADVASALVRAPGDEGFDAALRATAARRGLLTQLWRGAEGS